MDAKHLYEYVIVPTLDNLGLNHPGAAELLLGTAMVESRLKYLRQLSDGPALGLYQMEPATHDDIWVNYLAWRKDYRLKIETLVSHWPPGPTQLIGNLWYATAMARMLYRRVPARLPGLCAEKMALYHKKYYNTYLGATKVEESVPIFEQVLTLMQPVDS